MDLNLLSGGAKADKIAHTNQNSAKNPIHQKIQKTRTNFKP